MVGGGEPEEEEEEGEANALQNALDLAEKNSSAGVTVGIAVGIAVLLIAAVALIVADRKNGKPYGDGGDTELESTQTEFELHATRRDGKGVNPDSNGGTAAAAAAVAESSFNQASQPLSDLEQVEYLEPDFKQVELYDTGVVPGAHSSRADVVYAVVHDGPPPVLAVAQSSA